MRHLLPVLLLSTTAAQAESPNVVVDIAPLHSLVAQLMTGVGEPTLLIDTGASPHDYAFRPSDAAALENADVVIWMGEAMTPWLADPIATLAPNATVIEIMDLESWQPLAVRDDPIFDDGHDHGHRHDDAHDDHDDHDDHAQGDHEDHDHDAHSDDKDHAHDDHDDHGHDDHGHDDHAHDDNHAHGALDPHAWLAPQNASLWQRDIAQTLADLDPAHAEAYAAAADRAEAANTALLARVEAMIDGLTGTYVVPHDSLQYFETAFDIPAAGAIALSDTSDAGPAHIRELQETIAARGVTCILAEPQTNPNMLALLAEGTSVQTAVIDPAGTTMTPGPDLYEAVILNLATGLAECLAPAN